METNVGARSPKVENCEIAECNSSFSGGTPTASTASGAVDLIVYTVISGGGSPVIYASFLNGFA